MISEVLGEGFAVYRRLWPRSVVVAGLVFAVVELAAVLAARGPTSGGRLVAAALVAFALSVIGGLLVQGALVEVVSDLHEGRPAASIASYFSRTRGALGTLLVVTILAGLGTGIGFILLVVPGLILFARWSLVVPVVMLEGRSVGEAFSRSRSLVKGHTGRVLVIVIVATLISGLIRLAVSTIFGFIPGDVGFWAASTIGSAIAVPYEAHVLTVLYYRLTDPERPVLPTVVRPPDTWRSIWDEDPPK